MPNTCRTDTFMSGKPVTSGDLVMAAVVINPPRVPGVPETSFAVWLRMGAFRNPSREKRPAEARRLIKVPLPYHQDRGWTRFLEGCPANHAVLSGAEIWSSRAGCG